MTFKSCDFLPTTLHRVLRLAAIGWNEPTIPGALRDKSAGHANAGPDTPVIGRFGESDELCDSQFQPGCERGYPDNCPVR
jgi:hypothetical protein